MTDYELPETSPAEAKPRTAESPAQPAETSPTARRASSMAREMRIGLCIIVGLLLTLGGVLFYRVDSDARKAAAMKARLQMPSQDDEHQATDSLEDSFDESEDGAAAFAADARGGQMFNAAEHAPAAQQFSGWQADVDGHAAPVDADHLPHDAGEPDFAWSADADDDTSEQNPFAAPVSPAEWDHEWDDAAVVAAPAESASDGATDFQLNEPNMPQFSREAAELRFEDPRVAADDDTTRWHDESHSSEPGLFAPTDEVGHAELAESAAPAVPSARRGTIVSEPADDRWARRPGSGVTPASAGDVPWNDHQQAAPRQAAVESDPGIFDRHTNSYTVGPNENFWSISKRLYGSGAYFKALYEHNRREYPQPNKLRVGDVISAPPAHVLEQTYPHLCPQRPAGQTSSNFRPASHRQDLPAGARVYVVEEGDTLSDIARYELGRVARWTEIYELNREVLGEDFNYLRPGTQLVLPAESRPERFTELPPSGYQR